MGNKSDLISVREVSFEEANQYAMEIKAQYFEVSAKENNNINEMF